MSVKEKNLPNSTSIGYVRTLDSDGKSVKTPFSDFSGDITDNNFSDAEKSKLAGIESEANKTIVDSALSSASENPVQNKVVYAAVKSLDVSALLLDENILDTTQQYTFTDGKLTRVDHKRSGSTIRADTFTYSSGYVTETRTLSTGESVTIVTNLETLETTVTYSES